MQPALHIEFANRQSGLRVDHRRVAAVARHVLRAEGARRAEVAIAVVGDREMTQLNSRFLNHRRTTDVLSFDLGERAGGGCVQGQVIVCADTARRRAQELGHPIIAELLFYVAHGVLHLLGYDDATAAQRTRMLARQRVLLAAIGVRLKA